ncbi:MULTISPECIES: PQQ-binding-like beta-propeller repeat protein [unclassified Crossiella]|uniref:Rv3212 family protein n=1 Tax=unclassified Crossiella TaxID=2620835 RepID=UPI0027E5420C|nr:MULTISPECIES: PQQ-binding-like beta-propeller repeat protein [unclassified Crossiella]
MPPEQNAAPEDPTAPAAARDAAQDQAEQPGTVAEPPVSAPGDTEQPSAEPGEPAAEAPAANAEPGEPATEVPAEPAATPAEPVAAAIPGDTPAEPPAAVTEPPADAPAAPAAAVAAAPEPLLAAPLLPGALLPEPATGPGEAEPPPPVPPRSFVTRWDLVATAVITVTVLVAGLLVWTFSDARATVSQTSNPPLPMLDGPTALPPTLAEVWRSPSTATQNAVTTSQVVVTADNGAVVGRDPLSGQERWRYQRDLPLCTVAPAFGQILAVFQRGDTCSEVTALDPATGKRGAQRNGDAEVGTRLLVDGVHLTTTGKKYLEGWRSDLVKTQEYGQVRAMVQPGKQLRTGCAYGSVAVTPNRVGVIERCPDDPGDRLTVFKPNPKDFDKPEASMSVVLSGAGARVIALGPDRVAAALPDPARLAIYDGNGAPVSEVPLNLPASDLQGDPEGGVAPTTIALSARCSDGTATPLTFAANTTCPSGEPASTVPTVVYWWTGSRTIALASATMTPLWTMENTLGPGTLYAGRLMVPTPAGLSVADPNTGALLGRLPLNREGYRGPVTLASAGPVLVEQRGGTLVALR